MPKSGDEAYEVVTEEVVRRYHRVYAKTPEAAWAAFKRGRARVVRREVSKREATNMMRFFQDEDG